MPQTPNGYIQLKNGGQACDVAKCKAVCCRVTSFIPDKPPPCEFLTDRNTCRLHELGGPPAKFHGCVIFPRDQRDIDVLNKQLADQGIKERCLLRFD